MLIERVEILKAACCIAGADGEISQRERESLKKMADEIGVGAASLDAMMDLAITDEKFRGSQLRMVHKDPAGVFETLYRMARLDPDVPTPERKLLTHFGRKLGLDTDQMNEIIRRAHGA